MKRLEEVIRKRSKSMWLLCLVVIMTSLTLLTHKATFLLPQLRNVLEASLPPASIPKKEATSFILGIPDRTAQTRIKEAYSQMPLRFEVNQGQTDARVKFLSRGNGHSLFLTCTEAVLVLNPTSRLQNLKSSDAKHQIPDTRYVLRMQLIDANPEPRVIGLEELPGKSNYFIGHDPQKWYTNVATYTRVEYQDIYPGVNLVYYGNQQQLKYDFIVAPGVDPGVIRFNFKNISETHNHTPLYIDAQGNLVLPTAVGDLHQRKPLIYQEINGIKRIIPGHYAILKSGSQSSPLITFQVAAYDTSKPLIIDPVLSYATYFGGSGEDEGFSITVDTSDNLYITGRTGSVNFPTTNPTQAAYGGGSDDAFVMKLNSKDFDPIYTTYLGGKGSEIGFDIAVDSSDNAYIIGTTDSSDFPTVNPLQATGGGAYDVFVAKLNPKGSDLIYATYLGGDEADHGRGIDVDTSGNAYLTGYTKSTNFPTKNPFQAVYGGGEFDTFVAKLTPEGSALVYSTYLGGSNSDSGRGITVDAFDCVYVAGRTASHNFPVVNPIQASYSGGIYDAFVTKINEAGSALVYSTYLGGNHYDYGFEIVVDASGNAYITGYTNSINFPSVNPFQATYGGGQFDAFVMKLNPAGSALVYSTYFGGSHNDQGLDIFVDTSGNAYITGLTSSSDLPMINPFQPTYGGGQFDAFVTKLNPAGFAPIYSSYLGGNEDDNGYGIVVDTSGQVYVTGVTHSTDFPTIKPFQAIYGGGVGDGFVVKIDETTLAPTPDQ